MKYVVLGSSAAGVNGVRELRKIDKNCEIILISKDEDIYSAVSYTNIYAENVTKRESAL